MTMDKATLGELLEAIANCHHFFGSAEHPDTFEHEAISPKLAILNRDCHFGKFIGKFWQMLG
ncbi:hypothetical protein [Janthinobacterium sp. LB3P112]|uniref:hypothetical protein n=1 Tax=Janthinobacterium sp. LB3P112 TaxID=3424196 RepID=UPI003F27FFE2